MTIRRSRKITFLAAAILPVFAFTACSAGDSTATDAAAGDCSDVTLRLSHQWPDATGDEGDFRAVVAAKFAAGVEKATDGEVKVQIFPNSTLSKSTEQYDAMMQGAIDMSVFPLDYASGRVPQFSVTLMPALVRSHGQAKAWETSPIGDKLLETMDENGSKPLVWIWNAGAIGSKGAPVQGPGDITPGMTMRAAGGYVEHMLADAGAGITSLPSSELYTAMQTGVLDGAITSTGSFASYNLQEQVKSYTSPTDNTFWFMFEPLIVSNKSFDKLCASQQDALVSVGKDIQDFAYSASEADDARVDKIFSDAGVDVVQMDDAAFAEWQTLAKKQWADFAANVDGGEELLKLAQEVPSE